MNRRSFFRSLIVSAVAPQIFIPKIERVRWKPNAQWMKNPAWENAQYEVATMYAVAQIWVSPLQQPYNPHPV